MNIVIAYDSNSLDSLVDVTFLSEPHGLISVVLFSKDNFCYYIFFSFFFLPVSFQKCKGTVQSMRYPVRKRLRLMIMIV